MSEHLPNKGRDTVAISKAALKKPRLHLNTKAEFLEYKTKAAKTAFACSVQKTAKELSAFLDPRAWTREYPLPSVGIAVAAGFVGGTRLVSEKKSDQPLKSGEEASSSTSEPAPTKAQSEAPTPSLTALLVSLGTDVVTKAVLPLLTRQVYEWLDRRKEEAVTEEIRNPPEDSDSTGLHN